MIERKIQTEAYWQEEFAITDQDVEDLGMLFLETERPLTFSELAQSLIANRCQREESLIRRQLSKGAVYRPNGTFTVGEKLVFPHLDFVLGTVTDQRDGYNPEYDDFKVISVQLESGNEGKACQFAAELKVPHKLAFSKELPWQELFALSPDTLYSNYGDLVAAKLEERLKANPGFVSFRGQWLAADMMADVHIGHLNIAEAMLELKDEPLRADELLIELDLPEEIPQSIKVLSLNLSMSQDERFEDVGDIEQVVWGLRRWVPEAAVVPPARLQYQPVPYDRTGLDVAHLQLEREIDDEASRLIAPPTAAQATTLTLLLGYPHWRLGTLPLTTRTQVFFPTGTSEQRTQITFLDRAKRKQFPGWVVHAHRFVYGLAEWYDSNNIPVGAHIKLERTDDPHRVAIDFVPRRMQREWTRMATRKEDGELGFQMLKRPIACEYDEFCLLDEADRRTVDDLWQQEQEQNRPLEELVTLVFLELAKLNPSGMVHAKTLYAAVNIIKRSPPGPIFAVLFSLPQFLTTGDGYWILQKDGEAD